MWLNPFNRRPFKNTAWRRNGLQSKCSSPCAQTLAWLSIRFSMLSNLTNQYISYSMAVFSANEIRTFSNRNLYLFGRDLLHNSVELKKISDKYHKFDAWDVLLLLFLCVCVLERMVHQSNQWTNGVSLSLGFGWVFLAKMDLSTGKTLDKWFSFQ